MITKMTRQKLRKIIKEMALSRPWSEYIESMKEYEEYLKNGFIRYNHIMHDGSLSSDQKKELVRQMTKEAKLYENSLKMQGMPPEAIHKIYRRVKNQYVKKR